MAASYRRLLLLAGAVLASALPAQENIPLTRADGEWQFARLVYRGVYGRSRAFTDYPYAEDHLRYGLERLTRLDIGSDDTIELDDHDIMNFPWLYVVEPGHWLLSDQEADVLREYLLRGGFMMLDDFWGESEWDVFEASMRRVFPDRPIIEIPDSDPLMSLIYEVDKSIQIPGRNLGYQNGGSIPHWRGIYDDHGRLLVAINFNMDMGDAWEHADDPWYPQPMTTLAIQYAVNYVLYAMTH
jgi:hypothetical protein